MNKTSVPDGLSFAAFSDGYDGGFNPACEDMHFYMAEHRRARLETLTEFIVASANEGKRFTCIVYSVLLPWVAKVAAAAEIPCIPFGLSQQPILTSITIISMAMEICSGTMLMISQF